MSSRARASSFDRCRNVADCEGCLPQAKVRSVTGGDMNNGEKTAPQGVKSGVEWRQVKCYSKELCWFNKQSKREVRCSHRVGSSSAIQNMINKAGRLSLHQEDEEKYFCTHNKVNFVFHKCHQDRLSQVGHECGNTAVFVEVATRDILNSRTYVAQGPCDVCCMAAVLQAQNKSKSRNQETEVSQAHLPHDVDRSLPAPRKQRCKLLAWVVIFVVISLMVVIYFMFLDENSKLHGK